MPTNYEKWEDGNRPEDNPIESVTVGAAFRSAHSDHMLQMVGLIAHFFLKQKEKPSS